MIKRMKFSKYVSTKTMQNSFSTKYRMYAKYREPTTDTMEDVMRIRAATALAVIPATRETELLTPLHTVNPNSATQQQLHKILLQMPPLGVWKGVSKALSDSSVCGGLTMLIFLSYSKISGQVISVRINSFIANHGVTKKYI